MAYVPLQIAESTPPRVKHLIRHHVDMQFADVHSMLRLPVNLDDEGLQGRCNFSCASWLLQQIAGASKVLFDANRDIKLDNRTFKGAVIGYFPWSEQESAETRELVANDLYKVFRNPLVHEWAIHPPGGYGDSVSITKRVCTEEELVELESATVRPPWVRSVLVTKELFVEGLYWATRRMIYNLTADQTRMVATDNYLKRLHERKSPATDLHQRPSG